MVAEPGQKRQDQMASAVKMHKTRPFQQTAGIARSSDRRITVPKRYRVTRADGSFVHQPQ